MLAGVTATAMPHTGSVATSGSPACSSGESGRCTRGRWATMLIAFVKRIDARVTSVGGTLTDITRNTADTTLITTTGDGLDLVLAEGLQHHLFLGRVAGSIATPAGGA